MLDRTELGAGSAVNLVPHEGIAMFVCGASGTGKTTFLRTLSSFVSDTMPMIVLDPKGSKVWNGETAPFTGPWTRNIYETPQGALNALLRRKWRILYRPLPEFKDERRERIHGKLVTVKPLEQFYTALYNYAYNTRLPFGILSDDLHETLTSPQPGDGSRKLQTLGREIGIVRIWASQRAATLPLYTISESQWRVAFRLGHPSDHKRMQAMIGPYDNPPRHTAVYWMEEDGEIRQFTLDVGAHHSGSRGLSRLDQLREWAPSST